MPYTSPLRASHWASIGRILKKLSHVYVVTVTPCVLTDAIVVSFVAGIDFKIKTVELGGKKIKLQIW